MVRDFRNCTRPLWPVQLPLPFTLRCALKWTQFCQTGIIRQSNPTQNGARDHVPKARPNVGRTARVSPLSALATLSCAQRSRGPEQKTVRRDFTSVGRSEAHITNHS